MRFTEGLLFLEKSINFLESSSNFWFSLCSSISKEFGSKQVSYFIKFFSNCELGSSKEIFCEAFCFNGYGSYLTYAEFLNLLKRSVMDF